MWWHFYFGFFSAFSGQPLYEGVMYQLYNITMTSLPIMWFACFDFDKKRKRKERYDFDFGDDEPSK